MLLSRFRVHSQGLTREDESIMMEPREFFELDGVEHRRVFIEEEPVWMTLDNLKTYLSGRLEGSNSWPLQGLTGMFDRPVIIHEGKTIVDGAVSVAPTGPKGKLQAHLGSRLLHGAAIIMPGAFLFDDKVILGPGTIVEPGALIKGPLVVGEDTEIRQGAYIRGDCLVGSHCVVGHTTEIKASIMLDGAKAGHFAYIGDSILGRDVNLGAGTKLANLKMIAGKVTIRAEGNRIDTGRRKLGSILGDRTESGCNSVMSPGTLLGPDSMVYPTVTVPSGYHPGKTYVRPGRGTTQVTPSARSNQRVESES